MDVVDSKVVSSDAVAAGEVAGGDCVPGLLAISVSDPSLATIGGPNTDAKGVATSSPSIAGQPQP